MKNKPILPPTKKTAVKPKVFLGVGFLSMFFANQCVPILAIPFYQMTLGIDPFLLGVALTIPMIISTFLGPLVGHISDRCQSRYGRRRPFIILASWASGLIFGLIWMVPTDWPESLQLLYFMICSICYYICVTFLSVPMTCLAYEMSNDHHERTEIMGFASYFIRAGSLVYQWLFPLAKLAMFGSIFVGIKYVGWGIGIFIIGFLGSLAAYFTKEQTYCKSSVMQQPTFAKSLKTMLKNKPLLVLLLLTALQMCGGGFTASMDYYLIVYYLNDGNVSDGAIWKGVLSTSYAAVGLLSIPIIGLLSKRYGKMNTLNLIYWLTAIGGCLKWLIYTPDSRWVLVIDAAFCTAIWTAMTVLIPSMLADLCDEDELSHGQRREGVFVSLHAWVMTLSAAVAVLISGFCLNVIGFDANQHAEQSSESILMMRIILSAGTVFFSILPLLFTRYYKIDAKRSQQTRLELARKVI